MSVIRDREGEAAGNRSVSTVEDLEVFRRAYVISLDLHQASLKFPKIEQFGGMADQVRRASKSICESCRRLRQAAAVKCGVQALSADGDWFC